MVDGQAWIRVAGMNGMSARTEWMQDLSVPTGVEVDVIDFGYRVTITVSDSQDRVTLIADLGTGDAAQASSAPDAAPLVRFGRLILARRMAFAAAEPGPVREPTTELRDLVEAAGAKWIRTDLEPD